MRIAVSGAGAKAWGEEEAWIQELQGQQISLHNYLTST